MYDLLIRNTRSGWEDNPPLVDLAVAEGRLVAIAPGLSGSARQEVDATGHLLLPGVVDAHVHFNEPGRTDWEGWASGSLAAAGGGVTTVLEMPLNAVPPTLDAASFQEKRVLAEVKSWVDFGLWGGLTPDNLDKLEELDACGVIGFKAFLSPSGTSEFRHADWKTLHRGMKTIASLGRLLGVHAEDPEKLRPVVSHPQGDACAWEASRPVEAELSAVNRLAELSGETGCAIHIVHVSHVEVVDCILAWKKQGVRITAETCPHYLHFLAGDARTLGTSAKCAPPLRTDGLEAMWECLRRGHIDTVGSDHSPCPPEMKAGGFLKAWGGISGLQHLLAAMMSPPASVQSLSRDRLVDLLSIAPARLFSLDDRKGGLRVGGDADMVLVETGGSYPVKQEELHYRHPHSAYVGRPMAARVLKTWLRGVEVWPSQPSTPRGRLLHPADRE